MTTFSLTTARSNATKYVGVDAARQALNRTRGHFTGSRVLFLEVGSRFYIIVRGEDRMGFVIEAAP